MALHHYYYPNPNMQKLFREKRKIFKINPEYFDLTVFFELAFEPRYYFINGMFNSIAMLSVRIFRG